MRIGIAVPEAHINEDVLNAALEATTRLDESLIRSGAAPTFRDALERVRWKPEPPGQEHFDHAAMVLSRGHGDCDDLGPWEAASLRVTGADRGARAVVEKVGPKRWHAVVRKSDGRRLDPSAAAGMPTRSSSVVGGVLPLMQQSSSVVGSYIEHPRLAMRPVFDRAGQHESWEARADLPWHWHPGRSPLDIAMVSLHKSPIAAQALAGACVGMARLGAHDTPMDPAAVMRLQAISDVAGGMPYEEVCGIYGQELADHANAVVGSLFGSIAKTVKKAAHTVAHVASPIIRNKYVQMAAAATGQAFGIPAPATLAAMNAAGKGLAMVDKATGVARKMSVPEAVAHLATNKSLTVVHPKTGQVLQHIAPPPPPSPHIETGPTGLSPLWGAQRAPLHPSALPREFNLRVIPVP